MDWTAQVDIYCERLDGSYWAEPLNALTNLAFILAALWATVEARRQGAQSAWIWITTLLAYAIGVGSFLFHTHATTWASLADVAPIALFVILYAVAALCLLMGGGAGRAAIFLLGVIVFLAATGYLTALSGIRINGSESYLPALALMAAITALAAMRAHPARPWFAAATGTFALSLTFRSLDMAVCTSFPVGTHIFWHILNGLVIALLLQALIRNTPRTTTA